MSETTTLEHVPCNVMECSIDGCEKSVHAQGWCQPHYRLAKRHGDPEVRTYVYGDNAERFWHHVEKIPGGCWEWTAAKDRDGYGWFSMRRDGKFHQEYAHRVVWELIHDEKPGELVMHHCDNPGCVKPGHLFEGGHAANRMDSIHKGRWIRGRDEKGRYAVITDLSVVRIETN